MVVLQEFSRAAIDACLVALPYDAPLPSRRVALSARRVDRACLRVMDESPQERVRGDPLDHTPGDRRAVFECAAVGTHVEHDLGLDHRSTTPHQADQCVGSLLWDARPASAGSERVRGRVRRVAPREFSVYGGGDDGEILRRKPEATRPHPVDVDAPPEPRASC